MPFWVGLPVNLRPCRSNHALVEFVSSVSFVVGRVAVGTGTWVWRLLWLRICPHGYNDGHHDHELHGLRPHHAMKQEIPRTIVRGIFMSQSVLTLMWHYLFYNSSQRMEYDSNSLMGICSSVAVLRQSLMAARTSSIISDAHRYTHEGWNQRCQDSRFLCCCQLHHQIQATT